MSSGRDRIPRLLPGLHPTVERLDVADPRLAELRRLTGGAGLVGSGAVEDELLALGQGSRSLLQIAQRDGALEPDARAPAVVVGAHEERAPRLHGRPGVRDTDPLHLSLLHD